jgi:hypothetical protein
VTRTVTNDYTFQHGGFRYQIEAKMLRNKIAIQERLDGLIRASFEGKHVHFFTTGHIKAN